MFRGAASVPIDEATAEKIWRSDVSILLERVQKGTEEVYKRCEHERVQPNCRLSTTKIHSACSFRWAVTECIVITGEMSGVARHLETVLQVPIQMGKVSWLDATEGTSKSIAGLLVSCENCRFLMPQVFRSVMRNN